MTATERSVSRALRQLAEETVGPHSFGYLRPWMSAGDPAATQIFIVGANAATPFPADLIDRGEYIDALVHGGTALRALYLQVRGRRPSPTRTNTDALVARLGDMACDHSKRMCGPCQRKALRSCAESIRHLSKHPENCSFDCSTSFARPLSLSTASQPGKV